MKVQKFSRVLAQNRGRYENKREWFFRIFAACSSNDIHNFTELYKQVDKKNGCDKANLRKYFKEMQNAGCFKLDVNSKPVIPYQIKTALRKMPVFTYEYKTDENNKQVITNCEITGYKMRQVPVAVSEILVPRAEHAADKIMARYKRLERQRNKKIDNAVDKVILYVKSTDKTFREKFLDVKNMNFYKKRTRKQERGLSRTAMGGK